MNRNYLYISVLFFTILLNGLINAQDQKIGYYESDFVLSKIPEYVGIEQRLKILSDGWKNEIQNQKIEIESLEEDYRAKERQVFAAVRAVAQRNGYDFVFDRSGDIYMVYARGEWNLNEDILLELGIEIE